MRTKILSISIWLISTSCAFANPTPHWENLFKSWEQGCDDTPTLDLFFKSLVKTQIGSTHTTLGKIVLPDQYKSAIGLSVIKHTNPTNNNSAMTSVSVGIKSGTYYGIPVKGISFTSGDESGVYLQELELKGKLAAIKVALKRQGVIYRRYDGEENQAVLSNTNNTTVVLACDMSN